MTHHENGNFFLQKPEQQQKMGCAVLTAFLKITYWFNYGKTYFYDGYKQGLNLSFKKNEVFNALAAQKVQSCQSS